MGRGSDAISDAIKRASEIATKVQASDIPLPPVKRLSLDRTGPPTLTQRLQDINALSFPFVDTSTVKPKYGEVLETYKIPENVITYVLGRNCEQINRIQREANCRIYIESEPREGSSDVLAALVGPKNNVRRGRGSLDITVAKGKIFTTGNMFTPGYGETGSEFVEMLIPGQLAGLIIGKSGETIKHMQATSGAKMVMIQESCASTIYDKPLRITGEPEHVQAAVKLVNEILNSKEAEGARKFGINGDQPTEYFKMQVTNEKVGIVIGKGGETIREINEESGALVEISKMPPPNSYEQDFNIWGTRDQIITAVQMICVRTQIPLPPFVADAVDQINKEQYYTANMGLYKPTSMPGILAGDSSTVDPEMAAYYESVSQYQHNLAIELQNQAEMAQQTAQIDPVTGEIDYTLAWVEYFKNIGENEKAEELLAQHRARQQSTNNEEKPENAPKEESKANDENSGSKEQDKSEKSSE